MNIVDLVLLLVLAISVVYGLYHGLIQSVASLFGLGVAILGGFLFGPLLTRLLAGNQQIRGVLANYSDAVVRVGDYELATSPITRVSGNMLQTVLDSVSFPQPIENLLRDNILNNAFSGRGLSTVNDYVSTTLIHAVLSVMSFLVCCLLVYILWSFLVSLVREVFEFPILKQLDNVAGALFGLARGALICYLLVLLLPLVQVALPGERFTELMQTSSVARVFMSDGLLVRIIRGG